MPGQSVLLLLLVLLVAACDKKPEPPMPPLPMLASNAPKDQPATANGAVAIAEQKAAIAPYIEQARRTYPDAKRRYLDGLPPGHVFFAVAELKDASGALEQVFIAVTSIHDGRITGRIVSDILGVRGYKRGDPYSFPESELVDWLISRPDGTEEGNVVGKFLDAQQDKKAHP